MNRIGRVAFKATESFFLKCRRSSDKILGRLEPCADGMKRSFLGAGHGQLMPFVHGEVMIHPSVPPLRLCGLRWHGAAIPAGQP